MTQEESDGRDIDSLIQQLHGEGMPEAVEGDMLADTCSRDVLGDFMVEDVRRQGGEDGPSLLDCSQNSDSFLRKRETDLVSRLLDSDIQVVPASRFLDVLLFEIQHVASSQTRLDG